MNSSCKSGEKHETIVALTPGIEIMLFVVIIILIIISWTNAKLDPLLPMGIGLFLIVFTDRAIADWKKLDRWDFFLRLGEDVYRDFYSRRTFRIFGFIAMLVGIYEIVALFVPWLV